MAARRIGGQSHTRLRQVFSSLETVVALIASLSILFHLALRYLTAAPRNVSSIPLFVTLAIGGVPILFDLSRKLWRRELGTDVLAGVAIVTSVILGEYFVGAIIVLMFSGGIALEQYATHRASSVLDALAKRMPRIAHRKSGTGITDISLDQVTVGEILIVPRRAHAYAREHGISYAQELSRYIVHGLLHWLGHEDRTPAQQRKMRTRENYVLARCLAKSPMTKSQSPNNHQ